MVAAESRRKGRELSAAGGTRKGRGRDTRENGGRDGADLKKRKPIGDCNDPF